MKKICNDPVNFVKFNSTGTKCVLSTPFHHSIYHNYEFVQLWKLETDTFEFLTEDVVAFINTHTHTTYLTNGKQISTHILYRGCKNDTDVYCFYDGGLNKIKIEDILKGIVDYQQSWSTNFNYYGPVWDALHRRILALSQGRYILALEWGKVKEIVEHKTKIWNLNITPQGNFLWYNNEISTIILDNKAKEEVARFKHTDKFEISANEKMFLFVFNNCLSVGEVDGWRIIKEYYFGEFIYDVKFNPDGMTFAVVLRSGAYVLDLE